MDVGLCWLPAVVLSLNLTKQTDPSTGLAEPGGSWISGKPAASGVVVVVCFLFVVVFGTEGCGRGWGPACSPGVSICCCYNPVAPKGIPEVWLMQGMDCMDLGKSWLTTLPFSPLPPPLAPVLLSRGSVDVLMASLMDCCGIKQKPFSGGPGVPPLVHGSDWQGKWVNTGLKLPPPNLSLHQLLS